MTTHGSHGSHAGSHAPAEASKPQAPAPRVLVVDDEPGIVTTLRAMLEHHGYAVETAGDGLEAYTRLKDGGIACMLLDIHMPRINGIELLLLMQTEGLRVPTIAMASFDDFNESEMKQFASVRKFLPKPFQMADAIAAVRECIPA